MKVRIDRKGYEHFNGQMGHIQFKDGVSVTEISQFDADRLGCIIPIQRVEETTEEVDGEIKTTVEDKGQVSSAVKIVEARRVSAPVVHSRKQVEVDKKAAKEQEAAEAASVKDLDARERFTQAQLEVIADEKGMKGLREVGEIWKVKGNSIAQLIRLILAAQNAVGDKKAVEAEKSKAPAEEVAE